MIVIKITKENIQATKGDVTVTIQLFGNGIDTIARLVASIVGGEVDLWR